MIEHNMEGLSAELRLVEQMVREAGDLVLDCYDGGDTTVSWKGTNDPVTEADRRSNEHLVTALSRNFPEDGILSEESADSADRLGKRRVWIVDPLDGTREFIDRIGEFSVMVGLTVDGVPVLGVVYQPTARILYRGIPGQVAEVEAEGIARPLAVSAETVPSAMRLVASRSHRNPLVDTICQRIGVTRERPSGSVGLKIGLLATAECDLYLHPSPGLKEWDTCAPEAILRAAGGKITDGWGRPLAYNRVDVRHRYGLVSSNGRCHDTLVAATVEAAGEAGYAPDTGFW
jgi:3'(2'), 5'-bisphosphate nucleotidase